MHINYFVFLDAKLTDVYDISDRYLWLVRGRQFQVVVDLLSGATLLRVLWLSHRYTALRVIYN